MVSLMGRLSVVILSVTATLSAAEIKPPDKSPRDNLVRVYLEAGERATVLGANFSAVDSTPTPYGLAFTGPPKKYVVLVVTDQSLETLFVEIVAGGPEPDPPEPDPDPPGPEPPEPDETLPVDLLQRYGIAPAVYRAARKAADPGTALTLGNAAVDLANQIHRSQMLPSDARAQLASAAAGLGTPWVGIHDRAIEKMEAFAAANGSGSLIWRDMIWEFGLALQRAAK